VNVIFFKIIAATGQSGHLSMDKNETGAFNPVSFPPPGTTSNLLQPFGIPATPDPLPEIPNK
jgi:hypothetical protein